MHNKVVSFYNEVILFAIVGCSLRQRDTIDRIMSATNIDWNDTILPELLHLYQSAYHSFCNSLVILIL